MGLEDFGDDEGSFPGRREIVASLVALSEPQHQVADPEGTASDSSSMVASESLLVLSRVYKSYIPGLVRLVQHVFLECFVAVFVVCLYPW